MYFGTKNYLKSNNNHTAKQGLSGRILSIKGIFFIKKKKERKRGASSRDKQGACHPLYSVDIPLSLVLYLPQI